MSKNTVKKANSYRHLTFEEREEIAVSLAAGESKRSIAKLLGRHVSTISRECSRNQPPSNTVKYRAIQANMRSQKRQKESHKRDRLKSESTRHYVAEKLQIGWTPELISGRIRLEGALETTNYESIYQWIYTDRRDLISCLPRAHRKRRKRGSAKYKHASKIPNRVPIENRPELANTRQEFGHWEADTAVSRQSKGAISVIVERTTRFVKICKLASKSALNMHDSLIQSLQSEPQHLRKSIIFDNGTEDVLHVAINEVLGTNSFFCQPYHSWEKGSVEQTIGLVRRTYPKKTDWDLVSQKDLDIIQFNLNHRPRKCLNFLSPAEAYAVALAA
jgi:transposase, IS30 family